MLKIYEKLGINPFSIPAEEQFFDREGAADFLGLSPRTLDRRRIDGTGPVYRRLGPRRIVYSRADLLAYLNGSRFSSTSEESRQRKFAA